MKLSKLILTGLALISLCVSAQDASGQAGAYLKLGIGARALGMGGAFTAVADDGTSVFWNPSGLCRLQSSEITSMHSVLKMDRTYNFVNFVQPIKGRKAAWGVNYVRFGVDDLSETHIWRFTDSTKTAISRTQVYGDAVTLDGKVIPVVTGDNAFSGQYNTTVTTYNAWKALYGTSNIDVFSVFKDTEWTLSCTYAQMLRNEKLMFGGNLKYLKQELFNYNADSFALDLGMLCRQSEKLNIGLSLRDIGANLKWDTPSGHKDKIPLTSTVGIAYSPVKKLNVALDYSRIRDGEGALHFGVEGFIKEKFGVRAGADDGELTVGASFKNNAWCFDYAFRDQELGNEHKMSASYRF